MSIINTKKYLLALDQGTTSSRAIVFDRSGRIIASHAKEFMQIFPADGYVEHDAEDILGSQLCAMREAIAKSGVNPSEIACIGITNQRETTIVWNKKTGKPICNAIVWQCRRTAAYCDELKKAGYTEKIRDKTGLIIDAYFSATKLKYILDHTDGAREAATRGELAFGTVDSWLIYNLTGGKVHATDYSNAARTMLFNINTLSWDDELLELFDIPKSILPEALPSSHVFGYTAKDLLGVEIPVSGVAGDQQAALFGQCCFEAGSVKNTYGTGGFMLMNTGEKPVLSKNGLLTTVAWGLDGRVNYALEGSSFICGAAVGWLRDGLGLIKTAAESEELAKAVPDNGGVYFIPAFVGLGAPYWDPYARGTIVGLTRSATKFHIVRAVIEAMAYQTADILMLMEKEAHASLLSLNVDGGACANNFLLQFQSDILHLPINRPQCIETTALGAAYLAALAVGYFSSTDEIIATRPRCEVFNPSMTQETREKLLHSWHRAVERSLDWIG